MWELDHKESWVLKNWCFWTVVLEKTLESPLDCEEIQPVHPKGDQSWVFIGGTDVEAKTPILWPPDVESWLIWKDPDGGKDWGQEEKGTTEDEMVGWHQQHNRHGFGWAPGFGEGQEGMAYCGSCSCKESDITERPNWTVKGFCIFSEGEVNIFLEFSCFSYDSTDVGNLISDPSAFSKSSLYILKFSVLILLKPSMKDFEHYLASIWNEHSCRVVWIFFGIVLVWA